MADDGFKRKLTAILSADVEGYSRLMGEDEVATVQTLTAYRELMSTLIQKHRGRVVDSPGDNLLAEFLSVVDAVRCSVEIQKELKVNNDELPSERRMDFRIGVNLGDVIQDRDQLYGDGVNIAARVEGFAEGGGICLSGTAYDHVGNKLSLGYAYLGKKTLKNIEKPVRVYQILMDPEFTGKVIGEKRSKPVQRRQAIIAGLVTLLLVVGALAIWDIYVRAPKVEPGSMKKKGHHMPDTPSITKTSELEAEKKRLADEVARVERERRGLEQMKALIEQKEKISELEAEKKRLADKVARVESERPELEQMKALVEQKKELEAELSRLEVEKKAIETNRRKELEIQTKGDEKQKLTKIPKEISARVETQPSPGPPYNLAIFPSMLQNDANYYLHHALSRIIHDIKKKDKLTLKLSFHQIGLSPGVKKIDDNVINSTIVDDLWLKKSSYQKNKPNVNLVRQIGSKLNVDGVLMLYFDVKRHSMEISVKKVIIYLIDIKTGKLFSERNITAISLYQGEFNIELGSLLSKIVNRYLKLQTG